jgi:hypothetical protein
VPDARAGRTEFAPLGALSIAAQRGVTQAICASLSRITDFQCFTAAFTVSSSIPVHFGSQRAAN